MAHEHSRPDRGTHVTIHWDNIESGQEHNFQVDDAAYTDASYDYLSIMHYSNDAFAIDRSSPTITTADGLHDNSIGQRVGMSQYDADQLAAMYSEVKSGCVSSQLEDDMGCTDNEGSCSSLSACITSDHNRDCCGCGGGTQYRCWSGSQCSSPATLPVTDHSACVLDRTSAFSGYECVIQHLCSYTVRIMCEAHPGYYWDYSPVGCCQLPPFGAEICNGACTFDRV